MKSSRFLTAYATCAPWSSTDDDGLIYQAWGGP